jgi:hypothetical protein
LASDAQASSCIAPLSLASSATITCWMMHQSCQ